MMSQSAISRQKRVPRATYRLQFHRHFTLQHAVRRVPYLQELGISHVYASPLLKAVAGSLHGYDVCDGTRINPEIGTEADWESFVAALHARGMGLVLDIVPNHAAASWENPWWWDVLKQGRASRFANHFDIDWDAPDPQLKGKVLVPVLGDECERVLAQNQLTVEIQNDAPVLRYFEHRFPLTPDSVSAMPAPLTALNGHPHKLRALLERQHYRLACWRHGDTQINYRRFFNIATLAGVRVEDPQVFHDTHALVLDWYRRGWLDGFRVDHPDGLRDPQAYLTQLRQAAPDAWIVVEKILEPGESLPADWPVDGTTGYDFLNRNGGLFIDARAEETLDAFYRQFTGTTTGYAAMVRDKKRWALEHLLAAELDRLVRQWRQIRVASSPDDEPEDWTTAAFRDALCALIACLPVYRTYLQARAGDSRASAADRHWLQAALDQASKRHAGAHAGRLKSLGDLLQRVPANDLEADFIMRFQQLTGPAMAKGVEDTSFYCFNRFVALNEVGGDPGQFGISAEQFHQAGVDAAQCRPDAMLASSTHDTKRSEDVRARLAGLSEIPDQWTAAVRRWSNLNERHRRNGFPDRNAEYLFYQTLVGAWPLSAERAVAYMNKAACEAKQHTNSTDPNPVYDAALKDFITATLQDKLFTADVEIFVSSLTAAGQINSLAQTLIKLTAPGVPDIYQGTELWDLSLVDPDNRRPVDFDLREQLMADAKNLSAGEAWDRRQEGLPKLWLILRVLALRAAHPRWFAGIYELLTAGGTKAPHLIAFRHGEILTVVPRWTLSLQHEWADTALPLPPGNWRNEFTPETFTARVSPAALFKHFPVALLVRTK
jgi:(1->4)-alpha-D-glucan 1-alpha-D-glucosylmutase